MTAIMLREPLELNGVVPSRHFEACSANDSFGLTSRQPYSSSLQSETVHASPRPVRRLQTTVRLAYLKRAVARRRGDASTLEIGSMTYVRANFAGAAALEAPLVSGLVATGTLPDRLKAFAGQHWVRTFPEENAAVASFDARTEEGSDTVADGLAPAGAEDNQRSDAGAAETHFVTRRENAVRLLTAHAGPYPWQPVLALALGIAFASLAIGVAADLGAGAAARPHYTSVTALPG